MLCQFLSALSTAIWIYTLVLIAYAVVSWFPSLQGAWTRTLAALVEPVVAPVRRIIRPMGGIDWSFLVVIIVLQVIRNFVANEAVRACYFGR